MKFIIYPAGAYQANCYIVYDDLSNEGFIIDPGGDADGIISLTEKKGLKIKFIILTHGHFDHVGAVYEIKEKLNIPVFLNKADIDMVSGKDNESILFMPAVKSFEVDEFINDGDTKKFGNEKLLILETPGHTQGSVSIVVGDTAFTGDTLFKGSVGRSDLPGGCHEQLINSIHKKLMKLSDETKVYPGHGPMTMIGIERRSNPFL